MMIYAAVSVVVNSDAGSIQSTGFVKSSVSDISMPLQNWMLSIKTATHFA